MILSLARRLPAWQTEGWAGKSQGGTPGPISPGAKTIATSGITYGPAVATDFVSRFPGSVRLMKLAGLTHCAPRASVALSDRL